MTDAPALLTTKEAAAVLGCSPDTVKRLLAGGKIQGRRLGGERGHWRITRASVAAFAEGNSTPAPASISAPAGASQHPSLLLPSLPPAGVVTVNAREGRG